VSFSYSECERMSSPVVVVAAAQFIGITAREPVAASPRSAEHCPRSRALRGSRAPCLSPRPSDRYNAVTERLQPLRFRARGYRRSGVGSWAVRAFGSVHGPTYPPDIADQWRCQTPKVKSTPQWQTT